MPKSSSANLKPGVHTAERKPDYYPAFLDLAGKSCIIIGGGAVAERKAHALLAAGARLTIISPELCPALARLGSIGRITHLARRYRRGDLRGAAVVIAATSDAAVNQAIARDAACPVNVVDQPETGSMIVPAVVRRGALVFAVSTGGASPAVSRTIRKELEDQYPQAACSYIAYIGRLRGKALKMIPDRTRREQFFRELASRTMLEVARTDGYRSAAAQARKLYMKYTRGMV